MGIKKNIIEKVSEKNKRTIGILAFEILCQGKNCKQELFRKKTKKHKLSNGTRNYSIILKGEFDNEKAKKYDLIPHQLNYDLTLFFIDTHYSSYWQYKFQTSGFLESNSKEITWFPTENNRLNSFG